MEFSLEKSLEILGRTPDVLSVMLRGISPEWVEGNEGEKTWNVKEVIAHLIVCEKTNWWVRVNVVLSGAQTEPFVPIDMSVHFELARKNTLEKLLEEFSLQREKSIRLLKNYPLKETDLIKTGLHPHLGKVNVQQLIATWVTHDLSHVAQMARIMAKLYKSQVGPFEFYLKILHT